MGSDPFGSCARANTADERMLRRVRALPQTRARPMLACLRAKDAVSRSAEESLRVERIRLYDDGVACDDVLAHR